MQAWRVHELGEPETVLQLDDVAEATPGPDGGRGGVGAAAGNFADVPRGRGEGAAARPPR